MKILLDTNIILDILLKREEFFDCSYNVIQTGFIRGDRFYLSASAVTDVYYLIRKQTKSKEMALNAVKSMARMLTFANVNEEAILLAINSEIEDFEDAVVDSVASNIGASFIVTRNGIHFNKAHNKVLSPLEYLNL